MTTRVVQNGRIVWMNERPARKRAVNDAKPDIPPSGPQALRSGVVWFDPDLKLYFRVVSSGVLTAATGWGTVEFWIKRYWSTKWHMFHELVQLGYFDAAIEEDTLTRKYRVLDIDAAFEHLEELRKGRPFWSYARQHRHKYEAK